MLHGNQLNGTPGRLKSARPTGSATELTRGRHRLRGQRNGANQLARAGYGMDKVIGDEMRPNKVKRHTMYTLGRYIRGSVMVFHMLYVVDCFPVVLSMTEIAG